MHHAQALKAAALAGLALGLAPSPVHAAKDLNWLITEIALPILRNFVILLFALALIWFILSVMEYIGQSGKKAVAAEGMAWSLLAMFVMVSVWGLVRLIQATIPLDNTAPSYPRI
ncbi:MAG: hypothetical protein A2542_02110 [Parcubacteria group bacterium RIFOXYD2_FULL_52_8]|nr:MAG: hypothetical protein A2542_02110 [Parcubacteria group bacterium RIFOXYD2_FULL_52_8]